MNRYSLLIWREGFLDLAFGLEDHAHLQARFTKIRPDTRSFSGVLERLVIVTRLKKSIGQIIMGERIGRSNRDSVFPQRDAVLPIPELNRADCRASRQCQSS